MVLAVACLWPEVVLVVTCLWPEVVLAVTCLWPEVVLAVTCLWPEVVLAVTCLWAEVLLAVISHLSQAGSGPGPPPEESVQRRLVTAGLPGWTARRQQLLRQLPHLGTRQLPQLATS